MYCHGAPFYPYTTVQNVENKNFNIIVSRQKLVFDKPPVYKTLEDLYIMEILLL